MAAFQGCLKDRIPEVIHVWGNAASIPIHNNHPSTTFYPKRRTIVCRRVPGPPIFLVYIH